MPSYNDNYKWLSDKTVSLHNEAELRLYLPIAVYLVDTFSERPDGKDKTNWVYEFQINKIIWELKIVDNLKDSHSPDAWPEFSRRLKVLGVATILETHPLKLYQDPDLPI